MFNLGWVDGGAMPQDSFLTITELASTYDYIMEEHNVTTEDGYILTVHRLQGIDATPNGKVVFLMHGIIESSDSWVLQGPDKALGYILADNGYDVWMGNARGNKHAMNHKELDARNRAFWQFTWEEIGLYDLPAMIDYVLNATGSKNLYYVGHSQGTTSFLVMNSMKPEYNEKIKMMFSLSPVAWMRNMRSPFVRKVSTYLNFLGYFVSSLKTKWPSMDFINRITATACNYAPDGCETLLYMLEGNDHHINGSLLPVILGHMPTGGSAAQFVHYGQLVNSGRFCRFDFGEELNMKEYGVPSPPDYEVTKITVPMELFYSDNDMLSAEEDVRILRGRLPNVIGNNFLKDFTHLDYLYAYNAKDKIYDKILQKLNEN
ncbi:lipase 1-like [Leguminivora glycinivorella]|uniref:lipase 1-like n=1 Tax=Leguminivora glycinivorella TaxID=1035111 RepID=UPI00200D31CC|nr:lipase 1-like [Leguminivora glycinivorella]